MPVKFGTDGWRGVVARDFTFDNVRAVSQAVADLLRQDGGARAAIPVGFDVRFLGARFAETVAEVLDGNGLASLLPDGPVTTPMVSCQVVEIGAPLGVSITASHNPSEYNGFKIKAAFGGSAPEEMTARVEALLGRSAPRSGRAPGRRVSFLPAYRSRLRRVVDPRSLRRTPLRVVVDSMHGSGGRLLEDMVGRGRVRVETIRADPDPLFGAHLGIATDGDGDRIGACDESGRILSPFQVFGLVALHLIETRGWRGAIARTFANTLVAERIASRYGLPFFDLPVGFKHVARLMRTTDVLIGGEESGGIGVKRFLPERDGILIGLLLMEMLATGERRVSRRVAAMEQEFGRFVYRRVDLPLPADDCRRAIERLRQAPPERLGGIPVRGLNPLDGVKLGLGEDGWILFRGSGTEPLLRIYCETRTRARLDRLMTGGVALVRRLAAAQRTPRVAE